MSTLPNFFTPNITKLNGRNYEGWRKAITGVLSSIGLWSHVSGVAAVTDYNSADEFQNAARRCYSIIINTIEYSQYGHVRENETPHALWKRLELFFRPRGFGTRLVLRRKFFKLRMRPGETMVEWIARVNEAVEQLRGIGAVVPDDDILVVLIEGLPKEYDTVVTALDMVPDNSLTVAYVCQKLVSEHSRMVDGADDDEDPAQPEREEARAMASYRRGSATGRGGAPTRRMPARRPAAGPSQSSRASTECHRCGRAGHIAADCNIILDGDRYASDDEAGVAALALPAGCDLALGAPTPGPVSPAADGDAEGFIW